MNTQRRTSHPAKKARAAVYGPRVFRRCLGVFPVPQVDDAVNALVKDRLGFLVDEFACAEQCRFVWFTASALSFLLAQTLSSRRKHFPLGANTFLSAQQIAPRRKKSLSPSPLGVNVFLSTQALSSMCKRFTPRKAFFSQAHVLTSLPEAIKQPRNQ